MIIGIWMTCQMSQMKLIFYKIFVFFQFSWNWSVFFQISLNGTDIELYDVFWTVNSDYEVGSSTWRQDKKNYNIPHNDGILENLSQTQSQGKS